MKLKPGLIVSIAGLLVSALICCSPAAWSKYDAKRDNPYVRPAGEEKSFFSSEPANPYMNHKGGYWKKNNDGNILERSLKAVGNGLRRLFGD